MITDDRDALTALLDGSAPPVPRPTLAEQSVLTRMAASASSAGMLARVRSMPRRVVTGLVAGAVVLGGGTAVAAAVGLWDEEFVDPDLLFTFTVPSGATCEERMNGPIGADDPTGQAVLDLARSTDLLALADVEAEIARSRAVGVTILPDGSEVPVGPGTPDYDADREYADAVTGAVSRLIIERLQAQGFDDVVAFRAQTICSGSD